MSPKVTAGAAASALSIGLGIIVAHVFRGLQVGDIATLTGSLAIVLSFAAGYLVSDPARSVPAAPPDAAIAQPIRAPELTATPEPGGTGSPQHDLAGPV
ncbi:MAG: hypothetical protein QOK39_100 [Acidimicrobiaceae bacterium]|nr:hypothetical protein [Acidimicrobiaceae bacterium]